MAAKAPAKKRTAAKATTTKKVTPKKTATKKGASKKTPAKKTGLKRLLEFRKKGAITRKGILIGAGAVVVLAVAFTGYSLLQGNGANAGGVATVGRWTTIGTTYFQKYSNGTKITGTAQVCKIPVDSQFDIQGRVIITSNNLSPAHNAIVSLDIESGDGNSNNDVYVQATYPSTSLKVGAVLYTGYTKRVSGKTYGGVPINVGLSPYSSAYSVYDPYIRDLKGDFSAIATC